MNRKGFSYIFAPCPLAVYVVPYLLSVCVQRCSVCRYELVYKTYIVSWHKFAYWSLSCIWQRRVIPRLSYRSLSCLMWCVRVWPVILTSFWRTSLATILAPSERPSLYRSIHVNIPPLPVDGGTAKGLWWECPGTDIYANVLSWHKIFVSHLKWWPQDDDHVVNTWNTKSINQCCMMSSLSVNTWIHLFIYFTDVVIFLRMALATERALCDWRWR